MTTSAHDGRIVLCVGINVRHLWRRSYMPKSQTTPGPAGARSNTPTRVAFRGVDTTSAPGSSQFRTGLLYVHPDAMDYDPKTAGMIQEDVALANRLLDEAACRAAAASCHAGGNRHFIDEHQPPGIELTVATEPAPAHAATSGRSCSAACRAFLKASRRWRRKLNTDEAATFTPVLARAGISSNVRSGCLPIHRLIRSAYLASA